MSASAVYGFFIGLASVLFIRILPQPAGSIIFWGFFAIQLTWAAATCWRRTRLPFATTAMALGAAQSVFFIALAMTGRVFPDLSLRLWVPMGAGLVLGPLFLFIESKANRAKWKRWADYMERKSAWDIVLARHIPQIRRGA